MAEITIRELRNDGGRVLDRVRSGEVLTVTRDGRGVAELRPLTLQPLPAATLLERWRRLPPIEASKLRSDLEDVLDGA